VNSDQLRKSVIESQYRKPGTRFTLINYDGLSFPPTPVAGKLCQDGQYDHGNGWEMWNFKPVPFWIRVPVITPLF
jgi:hypothetical protein